MFENVAECVLKYLKESTFSHVPNSEIYSRAFENVSIVKMLKEAFKNILDSILN